MAKFTLFNRPRTIAQTLNDSFALLKVLSFRVYVLSGCMILSYFATTWLQGLFRSNLYVASIISLCWMIVFSVLLLILLSLVLHVVNNAQINRYVFIDALRTSLFVYVSMSILSFAILFILWNIFFLLVFFAVPFILEAFALRLCDHTSMVNSICDAIDLVWANYFYALGVAMPVIIFLCLLRWIVFSLLSGVIPMLLSHIIVVVVGGFLLTWLGCIIVLLHHNLKKYEYGGWS